MKHPRKSLNNKHAAFAAAALAFFAGLALAGCVATGFLDDTEDTGESKKPGAESRLLKISGDTIIGKTLNINTGPLGTAEEIDAAGISYQWQRLNTGVAANIASATNQDYVIQEEDRGLMLKAVVILNGRKPFETVEVGPAIFPPIEGSVTFNAAVLVPGNTLNAAADIANPNPGSVYYEWLSGDIPTGDNDANYTIQESDVGNFLSVRIGTTKTSGVLNASPASAVQPASVIGNVTISGQPLHPGTVLGVTASFAESEITGYEWLRDGAVSVGTSATYTLQEDDTGHEIKLLVTRSGFEGMEISARTSTITLPEWTGSLKWSDSNPVNPVAGFPFVLVITEGNGAGTRTITWKLEDGSGAEADITEANLSDDKLSYKPALSEKGMKLKVTVSYSKNIGAKTLTSAYAIVPFTIKYNASGGTGTMAYTEAEFGDADVKLRKSVLVKPPYTFSGWSTTTRAKVYDDEANISEITNCGNGTVTIYAVWTGYVVAGTIGTKKNLGTIAGGGTSGHADGIGTAVKFNGPEGVCVDASDNIIIGDSGNNRIRWINPDGIVRTIAGDNEGFANGVGSAARFKAPAGVAVDASGNIIVADCQNNRIRKITPEGVVSTIAGDGGEGHADGIGTAATLTSPTGVAVDASGNIFFAEWKGGWVRKITSDGYVSTIAGTGSSGFEDGNASSAKFDYPSSVAVDGSGNVIVADYGNCRIRKITPAGTVGTIAGKGKTGSSNDGTGTAAGFKYVADVAVDGSGNIIVAESEASKIRKITPGAAVSTIISGQLNYPMSTIVDYLGNIIVADTENHLIRKITTR